MVGSVASGLSPPMRGTVANELEVEINIHELLFGFSAGSFAPIRSGNTDVPTPTLPKRQADAIKRTSNATPMHLQCTPKTTSCSETTQPKIPTPNSTKTPAPLCTPTERTQTHDKVFCDNKEKKTEQQNSGADTYPCKERGTWVVVLSAVIDMEVLTCAMAV